MVGGQRVRPSDPKFELYEEIGVYGLGLKVYRKRKYSKRSRSNGLNTRNATVYLIEGGLDGEVSREILGGLIIEFIKL